MRWPEFILLKMSVAFLFFHTHPAKKTQQNYHLIYLIMFVFRRLSG